MSTPTTHIYISLAKLTRFFDKLKSEKVFIQKVTTGSANGTISVDGTDVAVKGLGTAAYTAVPTLVMGDTNGTVKFNGNAVSVKGLGSAAYTASTTYATAAQGTLADSAVQSVTTGSANGTISVDGTDVAVKGLGTASTKDVASTGNASTSQVVMGNDSRLTDARSASDVYSWAKASTKPRYTASEVGLGNVGNFKAVSTVASQGLSSTEQANARANIGAGTSSFNGAYSSLSGKPTLGTAAAKDIATSGNASTTQVVMGNDTRLSDSRPASDVSSWAKASTKPSYTASEIGLGNVGNFKAVSTVASQGLSSTEQSNARANIGAGTSSFDGAYSSLSGKPTLGTAAAKDVPSSGNASTSQVVMGNDTRLTNSRPASDVSAWAKASSKPSYSASEVGAIPASQKGAASGVAELDANGLVPASQLPSFVDDILEYTAKANFPTTGETGKIYVDKTTNLTYRWSGTAYVEISPSLALGTTSSTAFRGDYGNTAYSHATSKGSAFSSGLYKITTNSEGHVTAATAVAKSDITGLGIPAQDTTYSDATQSAHGLMSVDDKKKLDGIASGAEVNQNAFSNVKVGSTTVAADGKTDTLELAAGSNVTLTPDATNDKVTIAAVDTKNTAGSTDTSSKIYLIGATSQAANPQTYSQDTAYVGTDGKLYSGSKVVLTGGSNASSSVSISPSTTDVYSMTSAGSVTAGTANVPTKIDTSKFNGGSFTRGAFSQGTLPSMTFAMDSTDTKQLNISFSQGTLPTHANDTFTAASLASGFYTVGTANTPTAVTLPGRSSVIKAWTGYSSATAAAQTFTGNS